MRSLSRLTPALGLSIAAAAFPCAAATIVVPPVEITSLADTYQFDPGEQALIATSGVTFPSGGGSFVNSGFTAAISQNDQIVVRFQAPAGKRLYLRRPFGASAELVMHAHWQAVGGSGSVNATTAGSVQWIGLSGAAPSRTLARNGVSNNGQTVEIENRFSVSDECSFEAVEITFPVGNNIPIQLRQYQSVSSNETPSFYASGPSPFSTITMYLGTTSPQVIQATPVIVTSVGHTFTMIDEQVLDGVSFPSGLGSYMWSGFTSEFEAGDQLAIRIEAPPGMRFRVRTPNDGVATGFGVDVYMEGASLGNAFAHVQGETVWIDGIGTPPTQTNANDVIVDSGEEFRIHHEFTVTAPFEFAAMEVRVPVVVQTAPGPLEYQTLWSGESPSFYASCRNGVPANVVMMDLVSIVPESIAVPPVEVTQVVHLYDPDTDGGDGNTYDVVRDGVLSEGLGVAAGSGFSASFGRGDEIVLRFAAPTGFRFRLHAPAPVTSNQLIMGASWRTPAWDGISGDVLLEPSVSWIGVIGTPPTVAADVQYMKLLSGGHRLEVLKVFDVSQPVEFEAVEIRATITNDEVANWIRNYAPPEEVKGGVQPSFYSRVYAPSLADQTAMELVPITPPPCPADANGDGSVNSADLSVLLGQFGSSVSPGSGADFNGDGLVNSADLSVLLSAFGTSC